MAEGAAFTPTPPPRPKPRHHPTTQAPPSPVRALGFGLGFGFGFGCTTAKPREPRQESHAPVKNTQLIGIVLISVYMGTDSFTSNWQSRMFKQYSVTSMVMMLYANLFSSVRREDGG